MDYVGIALYALVTLVAVIVILKIIPPIYFYCERLNTDTLNKEFLCTSEDLLVAFSLVARKIFGENCFLGFKNGVFERGVIINVLVKTGINQETKVVKGLVEIEGISGYFVVTNEKGDPVLMASFKKSDQAKVKDLFNEIQKHLDEASIYKGKAFYFLGDFIDLGEVSSDNIIYNPRVQEEIEAHLLSMTENPELCKDLGINLQRKVCFKGPFGSGKTIGARLIAKKAVDKGWTFMAVEPTSSKALVDILILAIKMIRKKMYQPAVVLIEDFDREQRGGDDYAVGQIMTALDGISSKDDRIIIIMTTNHPDKIHPGFQRPGRIDNFIDFGIFEPEDIEALFKKIIPERILDQNINWANVVKNCEKYSPAFVNIGVGVSAKLKAIRKAGENDGKIIVTEDMLVSAAKGLKKRHEVCYNAIGFSKDSK